jgi:hypothetical protein
MNIDLTRYVIARASRGPWLTIPDALTPNELRLSDPRDLVTLAGPVRVKVSVQARNVFQMLGATDVAVQERDVYSYTLDIPPGQTWSYPSPRTIETRYPLAAMAMAPGALATVMHQAQPAIDATGAVLPGVTPATPAGTPSGVGIPPEALNDKLLEATLIGR